MDAADRQRVLYVEDAFDQALLVKAFFNTMPDFVVTHAQDGDQAMRLIRKAPWDLLVTDLNLPGTDGFTVIRYFRSISPDTPILVTTGYTQPEYEEQALRSGANQVMIKPLNQTDFVARVRSMVAGHTTPIFRETDMALAVGGRFGDAEMGCGGSLMRALEEGRTAVLVPLLSRVEDATQEEMKAAKLAAQILGVELRVDRTRFGNIRAQRELLDRTLDELRPTTIYVPSGYDRDPYRLEVSEIARAASAEVPNVLAYETATTGPAFAPSLFVDVRTQMVLKMEALATYQSVGAARVDLRPRMAQAYARYWGRYLEFTEAEAFEPLRGGL